MKIASITEAKNNLSALIDGLKGGSPVLIVDRGRPVARLEPVTTGLDAEPEGRLSRLVRSGIVRPRRGDYRRSPPAIRTCWCGGDRKWNASRLSRASNATERSIRRWRCLPLI